MVPSRPLALREGDTIEAMAQAIPARVRDMGVRLGGEVFHRQSFITRDDDLDRLGDIKVQP